MAYLVVDFPSKGRRRLGNSSAHFANGIGSCTSTETKRVRFSQTSSVQLFQRHRDVLASEMWYSESDYEAMKMENKRAIRDVRRTLVHRQRSSTSSSSSSSSGCSSGDYGNCNDCDCDTARLTLSEAECLENGFLTGLERYLQPTTIEKMLSGRMGCYDAVLGEQVRQDRVGECDAEKIRSASRRHSAWARKRARIVGMLTAC